MCFRGNSLLQELLKVRDCLNEALIESGLGFPTEPVPRQRNVRLPLQRVVARERFLHDLRLRADERDYFLRQIEDREFARITQVNGPCEVIGATHEADEALDHVVHIAERTRLLAVAIDGDRLSLERLGDEVRRHTPVVRVHAAAISIENTRDLDAQVVLAAVIEKKRFGAAFALVVAGAKTDRIDIAPVTLGLWMHCGIAIDLAGRGLEGLRLHALGEPEHVDRAVHAGLGRLHRIELVVDRRSRAGQVVDLVHLDVERERHVVAQQLKMRITDEMGDVVLGAGEEIVHAQHVVPVGDQPLAEVRAQEPGAAGDQDAFAIETGALIHYSIAAHDVEFLKRESLLPGQTGKERLFRIFMVYLLLATCNLQLAFRHATAMQSIFAPHRFFVSHASRRSSAATLSFYSSLSMSGTRMRSRPTAWSRCS